MLKGDSEEIITGIGQMSDHHLQFLPTHGTILHLQVQNLMRG